MVLTKFTFAIAVVLCVFLLDYSDCEDLDPKLRSIGISNISQKKDGKDGYGGEQNVKITANENFGGYDNEESDSGEGVGGSRSKKNKKHNHHNRNNKPFTFPHILGPDGTKWCICD